MPRTDLHASPPLQGGTKTKTGQDHVVLLRRGAGGGGVGTFIKTFVAADVSGVLAPFGAGLVGGYTFPHFF